MEPDLRPLGLEYLDQSDDPRTSEQGLVFRYLLCLRRESDIGCGQSIGVPVADIGAVLVQDACLQCRWSLVHPSLRSLVTGLR
jgi:hypothetical protein